ncbi:M23 family metallopeptidase, partial [candidate division WOR-3 bacterium]|nr:M23 family metallopeptidase [candidate division WOR-3 bacterium]
MFKKRSVIFAFLISFIPLLASYQWPVSQFNSQHPITGTLGEYRPGHLHKGVDIGEGTDTEVYPVVDGVVTDIYDKNNDNECVEVLGGDGIEYEYTHINSSVAVNDPVEAGITVLGTIKDITHPHLHFEVNDGMSNPLDNGLNPYTDTDLTTVWGGNDFMFYREGTYDQVSSPLWGKVDILVRAKDAQSNGSNTVGIYRIGY